MVGTRPRDGRCLCGLRGGRKRGGDGATKCLRGLPRGRGLGEHGTLRLKTKGTSRSAARSRGYDEVRGPLKRGDLPWGTGLGHALAGIGRGS